jgi:hypothetical protein
MNPETSMAWPATNPAKALWPVLKIFGLFPRSPEQVQKSKRQDQNPGQGVKHSHGPDVIEAARSCLENARPSLQTAISKSDMPETDV